jgi:hypothetical protein
MRHEGLAADLERHIGALTGLEKAAEILSKT